MQCNGDMTLMELLLLRRAKTTYKIYTENMLQRKTSHTKINNIKSLKEKDKRNFSLIVC